MSDSTGVRVAVIGGGLTGLSAAHRLAQQDPSIRLSLFEASRRLGGLLYTEQSEGFLFEHGADNFITAMPSAYDLCRRIGLGDEIVAPAPRVARQLIALRGRLHPVPDGFSMVAPARVLPFVFTSLLSVPGKLRMACEYLMPPKHEGTEETLGAFIRRRLGREALEHLVEPLLASIFLGDLERLSVNATLPHLKKWERTYGSLIRALREQTRTAPARNGEAVPAAPKPPPMVTLRSGISTLPLTLASRLPQGSVHLGCPVSRLITLPGGRWRVGYEDGRTQDFDAVLLATPAPQTAAMLAELDMELACLLRRIRHVDCAVVSLAYDREAVRHPLNALGFMVPKVEGLDLVSVQFCSSRFQERAPAGKVLLRAIVGGGCRQDMSQMCDADIIAGVAGELRGLLRITGEPLLTKIVRWKQTTPQYQRGHEDLVNRIMAGLAKFANIVLAGDAYGGGGITGCVKSGEDAADAIIKARRSSLS